MKWYVVICSSLLLAACTSSPNNIGTTAMAMPPDRPGVTATAVTVPILRVEETDELLRVEKGICIYGAQPFTGIIIGRYDNGNIKTSTSYTEGKEDGWRIVYYPAGTLSEKRYYAMGEKDGVHSGWWENGHPRFEYHFAKGIYHGDYKEWYESGAQYNHIYYNNGKDEWGLGWRTNGKLYMNYKVRNGRRYGIINSNLCYSLKGEQGEYVISER